MAMKFRVAIKPVADDDTSNPDEPTVAAAPIIPTENSLDRMRDILRAGHHADPRSRASRRRRENVAADRDTDRNEAMAKVRAALVGARAVVRSVTTFGIRIASRPVDVKPTNETFNDAVRAELARREQE